VFLTDIHELRPGQWDERALRTSVFLSFFFSFLVCVCLFVRPSVSPSVHLSFFSSLTSPSSLAPFFVSLIYIFLVFFSGIHVIGLLSMRSNVHTTAYVQLLDFFYCQIFLPICTWNIWFQISTYLKDFSWEINGPKLARLCGKKKFLKHQTFMVLLGSQYYGRTPFSFFFPHITVLWIVSLLLLSFTFFASVGGGSFVYAIMGIVHDMTTLHMSTLIPCWKHEGHWIKHTCHPFYLDSHLIF
jgi:hypothetical protein